MITLIDPISGNCIICRHLGQLSYKDAMTVSNRCVYYSRKTIQAPIFPIVVFNFMFVYYSEVFIYECVRIKGGKTVIYSYLSKIVITTFIPTT